MFRAAFIYLFFFQPKKSKEKKKEPAKENLTETPRPAIRPDPTDDIQHAQTEVSEDENPKHKSETDKGKDVSNEQARNTEETEKVLDTGQNKADSSQERLVGPEVKNEVDKTEIASSENAATDSCKETNDKILHPDINNIVENVIKNVEDVKISESNIDNICDGGGSAITVETGATNVTAVIMTQMIEKTVTEGDIKDLKLETDTDKVFYKTEEVTVDVNQTRHEISSPAREELKIEKTEGVAENQDRHASEVSKESEFPAAEPKHIYPDLSKDIEKYRTELEQVSVP